MYRSLLYKAPRELPVFDEKLIGDLMLDRVFTALTPDFTKRKYFLTIISEPLADAAVIGYRAEILRDFCANPNLLEGMTKAFSDFAALKEEQQRERTRSFTIARNNDSDAAFASARAIAQISAVTAKRALLFLRELADLLHIYAPRSEGLSGLSARLTSLTRGEAFDELTEMCGQAEDMGDTDIYEAKAILDESGRVGTAALIAIRKPPQTEEPSGIMKLFSRKPKPEPEEGVCVNDPFGTIRNGMLGASLTGVSDLLMKLTKSIFDEFTPIARELVFYQSASAFCASMKAKGVPLVYPSFGEKTDVKCLYDLTLCSEYPNINGVVPNDFSFENGGIIITGENNSGKTVYMRSAACAQLLGQAGLPVAAKEAMLTVRTRVYTQYAAAEKEFSAGNDAGRFEQEVRQVAAMLGEIRPGSIVFINELFQTTAYNEGAEGLYHILRYLNAEKVGYVLVSHLRELIPKLKGDAVHMSTREGYKVDIAS